MKSKICIVTTRTINDSPCLDKYRRILTQPFDIIYWSKGEQEEDCGAASYYRYEGTVATENGKTAKVLHYGKFLRFARRVIKQNRYDKLIVYPTQMGWLLGGLLRGKYNGKYLYDVRDYVGENRKPIYRLTANAVNHAGLCSITCDAYRKFLPEGKDYVISHNVQPIDEQIVKAYRSRERGSGPIVLSFIGTVRFYPQQEKIIRAFGNDERFLLRFIGRGSEGLKAFCEQGGYRNVELIGQFDRRELGKFYMETDMAINMYGNDRPALVYALSNKLYSAALMGMPILCSPNTYMAEVSEKYGFGIAANPETPECADSVFRYYQNVERNKLQNSCDTFLKVVHDQEDIYSKRVKDFLQGV